MSNENILAENMRRFRTKNLDEQVKRVSQMSNSEVYKLVLTLVKFNLNKANLTLKKMSGTGQDATDLNMLVTFVKSIEDGKPLDNAEYIGRRLKFAEKYTQQLIDALQQKNTNFKPAPIY